LAEGEVRPASYHLCGGKKHWGAFFGEGEAGKLCRRKREKGGGRALPYFCPETSSGKRKRKIERRKKEKYAIGMNIARRKVESLDRFLLEVYGPAEKGKVSSSLKKKKKRKRGEMTRI